MSTQARRVFRLTSAYCWCIPKRGGTSCARVCRPLPSCGGGLAARTRAPVRALRRGCANSPRDPQRRTIANAPAQKAARTFLSQSSVLSCRVRVRRANSGRAALLAQRTTRPPPAPNDAIRASRTTRRKDCSRAPVCACKAARMARISSLLAATGKSDRLGYG